MWSLNFWTLLSIVWGSPLENRNPINTKCQKPFSNQLFCETSFMDQGLHKNLGKIINI
jgi:hypothetical protein